MFAYIGGKNVIGKWIFEQMPQVRWKRYVEVFGGAMWLYIKRDIRADEVIYNDYNPFLYNVWFCMAGHRKELIEKIAGLHFNSKKIFHKNKKKIKKLEERHLEEFLDSIPNVDVAADYIYLLTHCFSGDISGGMKLDQNTLNSFFTKLHDPFYTRKLDSINRVLCMDCEKIIEAFGDEDAFLYVDPPYYSKEHLYGFHNFSKEKHYSLAETLKSSEALWILSYYDYDDLGDLYPKDEYTWMKKEYTRTSSPLIGKPGKGEEVIIFPKELEEKRNEKVKAFFK